MRFTREGWPQKNNNVNVEKYRKQSIQKSAQLPKKALLDFLHQYRCSPTDSGFSPSQLLNGRQIRTKLDAILPSPAHVMQGKQTTAIFSNDDLHHLIHNFKAGDPCYALYFGPKQTKDLRWVSAVVVKQTGTRPIPVRTVPQGSIWRRQIDQLRPRYPSIEDDEPGLDYTFDTDNTPNSEQNNNASESSTQNEPESLVQESTNTLPHSPFYGPSNPRRSKRVRKQRTFYGCALTNY